MEMAGGAGADDGPETVSSDGGRPDAGTRVRSIHVIWEPREEPEMESIQTEPAVSVNVLCLLGAIVGIVSLFLPWFIINDGPNDFGISPGSMVIETHEFPSDPLVVSYLVFITGTVVAFLFPAAFTVQAFGVVLFLRVFLDADFGSPLLHHYELSLSLGFYVGLLSLLMVLAGFLHPVGPGYDHRWPWWPRRTEVSSKAYFLEGRMVKQGLPMPEEIVRVLKRDGSRAYVTAVAISLMTCAFVVGLQVHLTPDPATAVDDGVRLIVGDAATFILWDYARLTLTDGSSTVNWAAESVRWVDGHGTKECEFPTAYFGTQNLSGLVLGLTVVDVSGDGRASWGDMMYLMPSSGSSFAEGVSYRMTLGGLTFPPRRVDVGWTSGWSVIGGIPVLYGVVAFEFEDGEVGASHSFTFEDPQGSNGFAWVLLSIAVVAYGSAILCAVYYVPVRTARRRILASLPRRGQSSGDPDRG